MSTAGKVLVFGEDTRSFLATVRSLGRRGLAVHAAPANLRAPALTSRYVAAVHALPPWMEDGAAWLEAVEALLRAEGFDLVIPCNETALLPLQHHRARLSALTRLAIPDDNAIDGAVRQTRHPRTGAAPGHPGGGRAAAAARGKRRKPCSPRSARRW